MRALYVRRRLTWRGRLVGALVASVTGLVALSAVSGAATPASPSPGAESVLDGVSCVSAAWCVAVGYSGDSTLAESWDGSKWSVVPSPDRGTSSVLNAVSCVSVRSCEAVGYSTGSGGLSQALVESWNGSKWSVVPSTGPASGGSTLNGVSCVNGGFCEAVGYRSGAGGSSQALVESWNGSKWSVAASPSLVPDESTLNAVSCTSAVSCAAVGNRGSRTLVESWDGTAWSVVPSPTPGTYGGLSGVSCRTAKSCAAVGNFSTTGTGSGASTLPRALVESWNGASWSAVPGPSPSLAHLYGVSCASAASCKAVGEYASKSTGAGPTGALIESWNGATWSVVPGASVTVAYLYGVSCVSGRSCKAVGEYDSSSRGARPTASLVESWDGAAWSV